MAPIKDVSGTAFVVAEFRAEENRAPTPLYQDPVVGLFLSEESRHAAGLVEASFPPVKDMVKIRTRYFDDVLEKQLRAHDRQVVMLGRPSAASANSSRGSSRTGAPGPPSSMTIRLRKKPPSTQRVMRTATSSSAATRRHLTAPGGPAKH